MKKFIAGFMLLGVLLFSAPKAKALTIDDLYKEVQGLKEEVNVLTSQLSGKVLGATTSVPLILYKGTRGTDVITIQSALKLETDGVFGSKTETAVEAFQKSAGLPVTGVVDADTRSSILGTPKIPVKSDFLDGCNRTTKYSMTTGRACDGSQETTDSNLLPGCASNTKYSTTTGRACDGSQESTPCPTGWTGTYPNCISPVTTCAELGLTGTYPDCRTSCPAGWTGIYPNCVAPTPTSCPDGYTGTYPNCVLIVIDHIQPCPAGYSGAYPNCVQITGNFPAGCSSNSGFSLTTGMACSSGSHLISYWWGKVNQHTNPGLNNLNLNKWETDPDGVSGANLDMLTYCKKWFPNTTSVVPFVNQTLVDWHEQGNVNNWTNTKMSFSCI